MSWNPSPTYGSASWQGNAPLVTKNQLISSISGIYTDLQDLSGFEFQNLEVSTLTVKNWISAPTMYVSSLYAQNIDLSGIVLDPSGVFIVTDLSANKCSISFVSMSTLQFNYTMSNDLNITFDLGLGQAIGGLAAGLGALVGGAFIGIGAAIGGTAQGIATLIAGRPENFITNNTYETINFTSQLQISTLGNAQPIYSTIFRTVSSISANEVPGPEIFVSSFFYPGQICIRAVSDPFNLITGNSNLNTSTIQSFGQWVPLTGLEPEDIIANTIAANQISSGYIFAGQYFGNFGAIKDVIANTINISDSNIGMGTSLNLGYFTPAKFTLGSLGYGEIKGGVNYLWMQSDQDIVFSKTGEVGTVPIAGRLEMGTGGNESILTISTFNGDLNATNAVIQNLLVTNFSTVNSVTAIATLSTSVVEADVIYAKYANISTLSPFTFVSSVLGNPYGKFDITRTDNVVSTTYDQVSSLTQNILNYSLNVRVQNEPNFDMGTYYGLSPANVNQWGSTMIIYSDRQQVGALNLGYLKLWSTATQTFPGTFDLTIKQGTDQLIATQTTNQFNPTGPSTLLNIAHPLTDLTYRFTMQSNGWWTYQTPAPAPYITASNNNTFQIYQDINDTYIQGTDRLHLKAGDIYLDGNANFGNIGVLTVGEIIASNVIASNSYASNGYFPNFVSTIELKEPYAFTGSYNDAQTYTPINITYNLNSVDYTNLNYLTKASRGWNGFTYQNLSEWNNTMYNTITGTTTADLPVVIVGETYNTNPNFVPYSGQFWINNTTSGTTASFFPIQAIKPGAQGILSTIGTASRNYSGYTRVWTSDGVNWSTTSNVANPQGGGAIINNNYTVQVGKSNTMLTVTQPLIENLTSKQTYAEKIVNYVPQIRVYTNASPSFQSREAGIEYNTYFDANVVFTGSQSDAVNLIVNPAGNLYYPLVGWSAICYFSRIRTSSTGIQGFDIDAIAVMVSGTQGDFCWASARYLNVVSELGEPSANIRENYLMIPLNYFTYPNFVGPY